MRSCRRRAVRYTLIVRAVSPIILVQDCLQRRFPVDIVTHGILLSESHGEIGDARVVWRVLDRDVAGNRAALDGEFWLGCDGIVFWTVSLSAP